MDGFGEKGGRDLSDFYGVCCYAQLFPHCSFKPLMDILVHLCMGGFPHVQLGQPSTCPMTGGLTKKMGWELSHSKSLVLEEVVCVRTET